MVIKTDEDWADILEDRIIDDGTADSRILLNSLIKIFKELPEEDSDTLLYDRSVYFVCPRVCAARPFFHSAVVDEKDKKADKFNLKLCKLWMILLDSGLLDRSVKEIIYMVAHEMAHAFHEQNWGGKDMELEADKQVVKWGFEKELKACPYNYLYGAGCDRFK